MNFETALKITWKTRERKHLWATLHSLNTTKKVTRQLTAPFNNMRTLKFKGQPTNAFFATVNQMFGGSFELPTTVERAVIKSHR